MIHVVSERVAPIAAIEAGDTITTSKKTAIKRGFKVAGVAVATTAAAALVAMHLVNNADTDATTEED